VIPLSDGIPARRFPWVNVALIAATFAVWIFYELPHLSSSVFYACSIGGFLFGLFVGRLAAGAIAREPATASS
jgi:hypothetical protein